MTTIDFKLLSNSDINKELARRLKIARLNADLSQSELAALTGLSQSTIKRTEKAQGNSSMVTFIAILRVLKKLDQLDLFLPVPPPNPIQLSASKGKPKQRATRKFNDQHNDNSSEQGVNPFKWGDDS